MPYVSTGRAARALGMPVRTLQQWAQDGQLTPDYYTPGRHARWDVDRVREELRHPSRRRVTADADAGRVVDRLAAAGLSRARAVEHVVAGRVRVGRRRITDPDHPTSPTDVVRLEVP